MILIQVQLFPHVKYVMDKFKGKLPRDDLKRFAKEISKKLVNSDFKNRRVQDPTKIDSKKEKQVRTYVRDYFDKASKKHKEREQRRTERKAKQASADASSAGAVAAEILKEEAESDGDQDMAMSDDGEDEKMGSKIESTTPSTPMDEALVADGLKRKRECNGDSTPVEDSESTPHKILKSDGLPPPPPPPPPAAPNGAYPSQIPFSPLDMGAGAMGTSQLRSISEHAEPSPAALSVSNPPEDSPQLPPSPLADPSTAPAEGKSVINAAHTPTTDG